MNPTPLHLWSPGGTDSERHFMLWCLGTAAGCSHDIPLGPRSQPSSSSLVLPSPFYINHTNIITTCYIIENLISYTHKITQSSVMHQWSKPSMTIYIKFFIPRTIKVTDAQHLHESKIYNIHVTLCNCRILDRKIIGKLHTNTDSSTYLKCRIIFLHFWIKTLWSAVQIISQTSGWPSLNEQHLQ